jgi:hypothetical protein
MNKSWFSKLARGALVRATVLALVISPTLGLANTPHKTRGTVRHVVHHQPAKPYNFKGSDPRPIGTTMRTASTVRREALASTTCLVPNNLVVFN